MIETRRFKNVVIFVQTILSFVLSRERNLETLFCKNVWLYEKNGKKEIGFLTRGFFATKQVFP